MKNAVSELMSQCDATEDKIYWNVETKTFVKKEFKLTNIQVNKNQ